MSGSGAASGAWAGNLGPCAARTALDQGLRVCSVVEDADGPRCTGSVDSDTVELTPYVGGDRVEARNLGRLRWCRLHGESLRLATRIRPDRPAIVGGSTDHAAHNASTCPRVGTFNFGPGVAVPVFD